MGKIADVQLCLKAAILAQEEYSYSIIGNKLGQLKGWVAKWVETSKGSYTMKSTKDFDTGCY